MQVLVLKILFLKAGLAVLFVNEDNYYVLDSDMCFSSVWCVTQSCWMI